MGETLPTDANAILLLRKRCRREPSKYFWHSGSTTATGNRYDQPVGQKKPSAWGLYDIHGNVWEWCPDWLDNYGSGPVTGPLGHASGDHRFNRGGSWGHNARYCRSANRSRSLARHSLLLPGAPPREDHAVLPLKLAECRPASAWPGTGPGVQWPGPPGHGGKPVSSICPGASA